MERPHAQPVRPLAGPRPAFVHRLARGARPRRQRRGGGADLRAGDRRRRPRRRRARRRPARDLAHRDRAGTGRAAQALALGDQPGGQGLLVPQPRRGAGLRQGERRGRADQLRCRLLPDQLLLARAQLHLARGDVRSGDRRRLRGGVPQEPLSRARRLVGGGGRLSLAAAGPGQRLPRALRPHPRGPRRRADHAGGGGAGRAPEAAPAAPRKSRTRLTRGPKIITIPPKGQAPAVEDSGRSAALRGGAPFSAFGMAGQAEVAELNL